MPILEEDLFGRRLTGAAADGRALRRGCVEFSDRRPRLSAVALGNQEYNEDRIGHMGDHSPLDCVR